MEPPIEQIPVWPTDKKNFQDEEKLCGQPGSEWHCHRHLPCPEHKKQGRSLHRSTLPIKWMETDLLFSPREFHWESLQHENLHWRMMSLLIDFMNWSASVLLKKFVPKGRLELPCPSGHCALNTACLPISPLGRAATKLFVRTHNWKCHLSEKQIREFWITFYSPLQNWKKHRSREWENYKP